MHQGSSRCLKFRNLLTSRPDQRKSLKNPSRDWIGWWPQSLEVLFFLVFFSGLFIPQALAANSTLDELTEMGIEDLMQIEITSVSKKPQRVSGAAAAVFVITQDDIRRSGATSIPETLRMAPGLEVARIDSNKWAITSRGFNSFLANKLLVLLDGRTVYQPLFSGVYWDMQDVIMQDIDRIEVIRGPGATLWGANAVNGVINILTKKAKDTQGGLLVAGTGTVERGFGSLRYGTKIGKETYLRAYGKYFNRDDFPSVAGGDSSDAWASSRVGFRMDGEGSPDNSFTIQGDLAQNTTDQILYSPSLNPPSYQKPLSDSNYEEGYLLSRWQRTISPTSSFSLQAYYDRHNRKAPDNREKRDTFDLELQHNFKPGNRHEIVWGLDYRYTNASLTSDIPYFRVDSSQEGHNLFSAFVQDEILLIENRLHLILGSKFEHNDYTGFEVEPNGRLLWTPHDSHTFWGSVSRAVRTPSWGEYAGSIPTTVVPPSTADNPGPYPAMITLVGNEDVDSEKLIAYELGYRFHPGNRFSFDTTAFYNDYSNLINGRPGNPEFVATPTPHAAIPINGSNNLEGKAYGIEFSADWKVLPRWRLQAAYTYLQLILDVEDGGDFYLENSDGRSPHNQISLRSSLDLTKAVALDAWIRYVDSIDSLDIPSYATFDLRLAWKPHPAVELSLVGQNLLEDEHKEFYQINNVGTNASEVPRSVYGQIVWNF